MTPTHPATGRPLLDQSDDEQALLRALRAGEAVLVRDPWTKAMVLMVPIEMRRSGVYFRMNPSSMSGYILSWERLTEEVIVDKDEITLTVLGGLGERR